MSSASASLSEKTRLQVEAELELRRRRGESPGVRYDQLTASQRMAAESEAFELLFGGAAGPGKTYLLTWLARFGGHRQALLLRRTYPMLEDSLILESRRLYGDPRFYNSSKHVWSWKNGQRIRFGHCDRDDSVFNYQSAEFDLIGFDEGTQFSRFQYLYLLSRLRTTRAGQRVRVIVCTNPGGEGHRWIRERWAAWLDPRHPRPAAPGELRWYRQLADGTEEETTADDPMGRSRTFIPARLTDNPFLSEGYRATLNLLPEPYRTQLIEGDWQIGEEDDAFQLIPSSWVQAARERWREDGGAEFPQSSIGVDVARGGADETALVETRGWWVGMPRRVPGAITTTGGKVGALVHAIREGEAVVGLDVLGVGTAVEDVLRANGIPYVPVNFAGGSKATDKSGRLKMLNLRAEAYWLLRSSLDPREGTGIAIPPDPKLEAELLAPRWELTARGVKIEDKDDIARRLGRSPDSADALVYALWAGVARPVAFVESTRRRESESMTKGYFQ